MKLHIVCERDVGLFSLFHQVIANVPWALGGNFIPVVYFGQRTCYWVPGGYRGADTVWEYYFEPLVKDYPVAAIPQHIRHLIEVNPPVIGDVGYAADEDTFICAQYGDHHLIEGKALPIPYLYHDPDEALRRSAGAIIREFIRPRDYLAAKVDEFFERHMRGHALIGVHVRGTDAISSLEQRDYRRGSLVLSRYADAVSYLLEGHADARIFVATDDQSSLDFFRDAFGDRVIAYDSLRHVGGEPAGKGPLGCIMPAYIATDRELAARNGEEAVIEYLLLSRCDQLVHNGSSLARTVLLKEPDLPHINTHRRDDFGVRS
jgi:hypothetical protein